jgi:hypothetical protein
MAYHRLRGAHGASLAAGIPLIISILTVFWVILLRNG